jgi:hypothetical protein
VGCGTGDFSAVIHRAGFPVATADSTPARPVHTQSFAAIPHYAVDFDTGQLAGGARIPSSTVILRHVLEHVRDPRRFLEGLMVAGAAAFYIVVPNAASIDRRVLGRYWALWDPPRHLWHFTAGSLQSLLEGLGLRVAASGYDTIPTVMASGYRFLRLAGAPPAVYDLLSSKGAMNTLAAPLNLLLPRNVLWVIAEASRSH